MNPSTTAALLEADREYRRTVPCYYDLELDKAIAAVEAQKRKEIL